MDKNKIKRKTFEIMVNKCRDIDEITKAEFKEAIKDFENRIDKNQDLLLDTCIEITEKAKDAEFAEKVKPLIKEIENSDWIDFSCGRSTDYTNEFYEEGTIENLKEMISKILLNTEKKGAKK